MSLHYTIDFEVHIRTDIDAENLEVLKYLLNAEGDRPQRWPPHPYFDRYGTRLRPKNVSVGFNPNRTGACLEEIGGDGSDTWREAHLRETSLKHETVYEESLLCMQWLASLSSSKGFAGYIKCEETDEISMLLYVLDGGLYGTTPTIGDLHHMITGEIRRLPSE